MAAVCASIVAIPFTVARADPDEGKTANPLEQPLEPGDPAEPLEPVPAPFGPLYPTTEPRLTVPLGLSVSIGGGIFGFIGDGATDVTDPIGGAWDARLAFGTRNWISLEAAYVGGALGLDTLGVDGGATLIATTLEAGVRVNLRIHSALWPFAAAGVGWRRYDLVNTDVNTSSVSDGDNVVQFPLAVGIAYRYRAYLFDGRAVFRPTIDNDLIGRTADERDDSSLHSWEISFRVGWEI